MFRQVLCTLVLATLCLVPPSVVQAQATTTAAIPTKLTLSICGNALVDDGEQCDVPGENGAYSTSIVGRQCSIQCDFGPYCGDGILQAVFSEECDDGNNNDNDFCSALCTVEPAGSGGGGSSGGGGGGGGSRTPVGETQISISGLAYPNRTVNILLDTRSIGTVQANTSGSFEFTTRTTPGSASLGFWSMDTQNVRSVTFNTTFDVTQGAITNITGIILPPTIRVQSPTVSPGAIVPVSGQSVPNASIEVYIDNGAKIERTTSDGQGNWSLQLDTGTLTVAEHTLKARSISNASALMRQSSFSSVLQLFVGVEGKPVTASDLSRDGRVNLTDFSILIFWWGTDGGNSNPPADINGNARVGIEDFSILLFNWTG